MFQEFKRFCLTNTGLKYHLYKEGLKIIAKVLRAEEFDDGLYVYFESGVLILLPNFEIRKKPRPSNLIIACKECFQISNDKDEPLGYIYLENKDSSIVL